MRDPNSRMSTCVFGRKRRWRLVKRLINKDRTQHHDVLNLAQEAREVQSQNTVHKRLVMCAIAARLSRRPLTYIAAQADEFWSLWTVQQVRELTFREFRTLTRTIFLCLDPIARSITRINVRLILRKMPRFLFKMITIQSEVCSVFAAKPLLLQSLRTWCRRWESKCSRLVISQVRIFLKHPIALLVIVIIQLA